MLFSKQNRKRMCFVSLVIFLLALPLFAVHVFADTREPIEFDLSYGNVSFTDAEYAGYNADGVAISGTHSPENLYHVIQSGSGTTNHVISVGTPQTPVTQKFEIHLRGVRIDAPKTIASHAPAIYVNTSSDVVYLILDDQTTNTLKAYAKILDSSKTKTLLQEASRFGHAAIEKEIDTKGTLVVTCEQGYAAYQSGNTEGHDCAQNGSCGSLTATAVGEAGFISTTNSSGTKTDATRTAAAAAIGSKAEVSEDANVRKSLSKAPTYGTLYNLVIAGGKITATGATGNYNNVTMADIVNGGEKSKRVYLGGSPGIGVGAGFQQYSIGYAAENIRITGGYINSIAGDGSAANIGGGYHAGKVGVSIYGGTIIATGQATIKSYTGDMKRGAGIGGGGGGATSNATAGATVRIYGGTITASSSYGAAIGAGGGGSSGQAKDASVYIYGGTINATTTVGFNGEGAGAAIGAGGSLGTGKGGKGTVTISGGTITASSAGGADIGGGGTNSTKTEGVGGQGVVTISGGTIKAQTGGIGGGKANAGVGGTATITISGGDIKASSIGGGHSKQSNGGDCTLNVSGGTIQVDAPEGVSIGGGNGSQIGGTATLTVSGDAKLYTGSIGGGGYSANSGTIGPAFVTISGGTVQGQVIMEGENSKGEKSTFTMTGGIIDNENAIAYGYNFVESNGGAICVKTGTATITGGIIKSCGNDAILGGAIYLTGGEVTIGGNAVLERCVADEGGLIYVNDGNVTIQGGTLQFSSARIGGLVSVNGGNLTVSAGALLNGQATSGGAIYLSGGNISISGGKISGNKADQGAGAFLDSNVVGVSDDPSSQVAELTISGGSITNNHANNGAGVYLADGTINVTGGTISENIALVNGGGAYLGGGALTISGESAEIEQNEAVLGAGAYLGGGTLKVNDGASLIGNVASSFGGGAYVSGGTLFVDGGNFKQNDAAHSGGGAFVTGGDVVVYSGTFQANEALAGNGGAIAINNGNYTMYGGVLDGNTAALNGGAIYVSANNQNVSVGLLSGSIMNNVAYTSGGAVAVVAPEGGSEVITVTLGVNDVHYDADGNRVTCYHTDNMPHAPALASSECPVMRDNIAHTSGGAIYIAGGYNAMLYTYCLLESGCGIYGDDTNSARSSFMMVEGGTVTVTSAENYTTDPHDSTHGNASISGSIHVTGGKMALYGTCTNPKISGRITVDITDINDDFYDGRAQDQYYTVTYFENFKDDELDISTGQYTLYTVPEGETHEVVGWIYTHDGFRINEWHMDKEGVSSANARGYQPRETVSQTIVLYAQWKRNGYTVIFDPNTTTYIHEMSDQSFEFNKEKALSENAYINPGHIFEGWGLDPNQKTFDDMQVVKNLAIENDAQVRLYAIWSLCDHLQTNSRVSFYYTSEDATITRHCACEGYDESMTMIAPVDAVYHGDRHDVRFQLDQETSLWNWTLTPVYTRDAQTCEPINAGDYTATVTAEDATAEVSFTIDKAQRSAPLTPDYQADEQGAQRVIVVEPKDGNNAPAYEFGLSYMDSEGNWTPISWNSTNQLRLEIVFTNYRVYIRFASDENHYASPPTVANSVYYYKPSQDGEVTKIYIVGEAGLLASLIEPDSGAGIAGLYIRMQAEDGYYLSSSRISVTVQTTALDGNPVNDGAVIVQKNGEYTLQNIPVNRIVTVHVAGANVLTTIRTRVAAGQIFDSFANQNDVKIGRDSALSVQFEVYDYYAYTDLSVTFEKTLPAGTTLLLRTNQSYYYYLVKGSATSSIPFAQFKKMGTENEQIDGLSAPGDYASRSSDQYFLIVDFSQTAQGMTGDEVAFGLAAMRDSTREASVPEFPENEVKVGLYDVTFSLEAESSGMTTTFRTVYANSECKTSKWEGRDAVLVLTPSSQQGSTQLPSDLRVRVQEGNHTSIYYRSGDRFVIPLRGVETFSVQMESDLTPLTGANYVFEAALCSSLTAVGSAPSNGTKLYIIHAVSFTKEATPAPALRVDGSQRLYHPGTGAVAITITYQEVPENYSITATMLVKIDSGAYISTGTTDIVKKTQVGNTIPANSSVPFSMGLEPMTDAGSYCLQISILNSFDVEVLTVPYYIILD